jgi:hypothetical protein
LSPDQRHDFPRLDLERQLVDGDHRLKLLSHTLQPDKR